MNDLQVYSIKSDTFEVVEGYPDNCDNFVKIKNQIDDTFNTCDAFIYFDGEMYSRLWGRTVSGNEIAKALAQLVADTHIKEFLGDCDYSDDVRYAVYWAEDKREFVSVCIQDFDLVDYNDENFVRGVNGKIEFYRREYKANNFDNDAFVLLLCEKVCELLNESGINF